MLVILPSTTMPCLTILKAQKTNGYADYEEVWVGHGIVGEPLIDGPRLEKDNILSVFSRLNVADTAGVRKVAVFDFRI